MAGSYFDYLKEIEPSKSLFFDWIKLSLDNCIYNYGQHLKSSKENTALRYVLKKKISVYKHRIIDTHKSSTKGYDGCILSNAYSTVNEELAKNSGINVMSFPWSYCVDEFSNKSVRRVISHIDTFCYNELISDSFYEEVMFLYESIKSFLIKHGIKLIICYNDLYPLERMVIDAGKELSIPTGVFLHGLPGRYNNIDDNRADYLFVWGELIKNYYIKAGVNPQKIIVTGHPVFSNVEIQPMKDVEYKSPLVITYVCSGVPSNSLEYYLGDRGNSIAYFESVQFALNKLGISNATIRLHPSENPEWYKKIIDKSFYSIDTKSLTASLNDASFIIGPTSTVLIDALIKGCPYFGFSIVNKHSFPLVPPFDNSEPECPMAFTIEELVSNMKNKKYFQQAFLKKYVADQFNPKEIVNIIKK